MILQINFGFSKGVMQTCVFKEPIMHAIFNLILDQSLYLFFRYIKGIMHFILRSVCRNAELLINTHKSFFCLSRAVFKSHFKILPGLILFTLF